MADRPSWRRLLTEATDAVGDADDARRIVEEASGHEGAQLVLHLDDPCTTLSHARWSRMVERRSAGEPLQYVLGRWGFRGLDLLVDRRVLIPRPETELVVEHALAELDRTGATTVVDLGTGSGAIALSVASERAGVHVWATDAQPEALEVASANLSGIGRAATRVRIVEGDWFDALPDDLRGSVDIVISNPPYVADDDPLPDDVAAWEPREALGAGPTGLEAIEVIVAGAPTWLSARGVVVLEIGETQGRAVAGLLAEAGFEAEIRPDLTGRDRVAIGRR